MVVIWNKNIRELVGIVSSNKAEQTITVKVERVKTHPLYRKRYTVSKSFYAHDADNTANVGDTVRIRATKPMSKTKRWLLVEIVKKTAVA